MVIEMKLILITISILCGFVWPNQADFVREKINRFTRLRISSNPFFSDCDTPSRINLNETRLNRNNQRNAIRAINNHPTFSFLRNHLENSISHLNLRERKSRNEEIFAQNRHGNPRNFRNVGLNERQLNFHHVRKRTSLLSEKRQEVFNDFQHRLESFLSNFRGVRLNGWNLRWNQLFGHFERNEQIRVGDYPIKKSTKIERNVSIYPENENHSIRSLNSRAEVRLQKNTRIITNDVASGRFLRILRGEYRDSLQNILSWCSIIISKAVEISNYLLTVIAGLFIFEMAGQFMPVKNAEEKRLSNFLCSLVSVTGNIVS